MSMTWAASGGGGGGQGGVSTLHEELLLAIDQSQNISANFSAFSGRAAWICVCVFIVPALAKCLGPDPLYLGQTKLADVHAKTQKETGRSDEGSFCSSQTR